jgi:hypothetical protein
MNLEIDPDVKAVAEFMQSNVAADRLERVADAIGKLAPLLWGTMRWRKRSGSSH